MDAAQLKQRQDSLRSRRECELAVGDKAWLSNRNLRMDAAGRARKLEPLYFGPYEVLAMHGSNAAELRLPAGCRLHPVFNVDLLKKFVDGRAEFPSRTVADARPGPVPSDDPAAGGPGDPVYEVEAVIGRRGRGARLQYRVKWAGWPVEQASWLPASECDGCADAVADFERLQLQQQRRIAAVQQQQQRNAETRLQRWVDRARGTQKEEQGERRQRPERPCAPSSSACSLKYGPAAHQGEISEEDPMRRASGGAEAGKAKAAALSPSSSLRAERHAHDDTRAKVSSPRGLSCRSPSRAA
jgi:hypothetical protein